jgi:uncharacterized RDD family membrane protein YckC
MKTPAFRPLLSALFALNLGLFTGFAAEETAPPPAAAESPAAPEVPEAPSEPEKSELRRLDIVEEPVVSEEDETTNVEDITSAEKTAESESEVTSTDREQSDDEVADQQRRRPRRHNGDARITFWSNATLRENESADAVVSIVGSSTAAGYVSDAVVSILGSSTSTGEVRGPVVSILGSSRVPTGEVGDVVISILGNSYINTRVRGEVVAVLGNVELGPKAVIDGDVVCVLGSFIRDPGAEVNGQINHIGTGVNFDGFEGLHAWIDQCLKYGRPLAFGPNLMWAWWIAIGFLVFYIFVAALFSRTVERCVRTLEERPGYSLLTALLVTLITPLAAVVLLMTVIGTPALAIFLLIAGMFGKLVMLAWIGSRLTRFGGEGPFARPAMAVLVGGIIVLGLYTIPIVGFLVAKLLSWLGIGVVVYTIILTLKKDRSVPAAAVAAAFVPNPVTPTAFVSPAVSTPSGTASAGFSGATAATAPTAAPAFTPPPSPTGEPAGVPPPMLTAAPVIISAATLHRAGFWIRIAASVLDALVVGVAVKLLPNIIEPNFLLAYAAYCVVLWGLKGTTIGGIVCNLKVVRLNDQRVDWSTALVRALSGFLSFFAAGIGFIWVAFDDQRQSWHDKIAGTTIVHVPKGVSLV